MGAGIYRPQGYQAFPDTSAKDICQQGGGKASTETRKHQTMRGSGNRECRGAKLPLPGDLGVSPRLKFPQDWGTQGVEKRSINNIRL